MKYLLFCLCFVLGSVTVTAQDNAFEQDVRVLLEAMGTKAVAKQSMDQMIMLMKQSSQAPDAFWEEFKKEMVISDLIDLVVPIYMKHFTHEDVKGLIAFYNTSLGKKMTQALPQITSETMLAGQQWGMSMSERIQQRLKEKGY